MRVLQLIYEAPGSPFGFGGAGVRAYEIYRRLSGRHDITLLCMRYPGAKDETVEGLHYRYVGTESGSLTKSVISYTLKASDFVRRYGDTFDVIVENFLPSTPFFARFLTRTPVVLQVQGILERHSLRKFGPFYAVPMSLVEWFYPKLHKKFIFVSEVTKEKVLSKAGGGVEFSPVITNGVNRHLIEAAPVDGDYILFLSRIDSYTKGLDLLINAFAIVSRAFPDVHLVLAGYQFDPFDRLVYALPPEVRGKVRYAGFVREEEKTRLLAEAKFFVLPSRHESAPVSVLEAAACGKAVVVSDIPELAFVRAKGFGVSFLSGSAGDLADKMMTLLGDGRLRSRLGEKGKEYAKGYLWDSVAFQFEAALRDVFESGRGLR